MAGATFSPVRRPVHGRGEAVCHGGQTYRGDVDGCGVGGGNGGCGCSRCCNSKQEMVSAFGRPLARSRWCGSTAQVRHAMQVRFRVTDCLEHEALGGGCCLACWAHPLARNSTGCACCAGSWGRLHVSCHGVDCFGWYGAVASEVSALGRPQFRWSLRGGCRLLPAGCTMVTALHLGLVFPSACHHPLRAGYGRRTVSRQEAHLPVGCSGLVPHSHRLTPRALPGGPCSIHVVHVVGPSLLSRCWVVRVRVRVRALWRVAGTAPVWVCLASLDVVVPSELELLYTTLISLRAGFGRRSAPCEASLLDGCSWPAPPSQWSTNQAIPLDGCSWLMPHSQWLSAQAVLGVVVYTDEGCVLSLAWPCLWCGLLPPFWFNYGEHVRPSIGSLWPGDLRSCPTIGVFAGGCHARWVWSTVLAGRPCSCWSLPRAASRRIGEASNPGPESTDQVYRILSANVTAANSAWPLIANLAWDVALLQESRLGVDSQIFADIRRRGWRVLAGQLAADGCSLVMMVFRFGAVTALQLGSDPRLQGALWSPGGRSHFRLYNLYCWRTGRKLLGCMSLGWPGNAWLIRNLRGACLRSFVATSTSSLWTSTSYPLSSSVTGPIALKRLHARRPALGRPGVLTC